MIAIVAHPHPKMASSGIATNVDQPYFSHHHVVVESDHNSDATGKNSSSRVHVSSSVWNNHTFSLNARTRTRPHTCCQV